ncbi:MAG: 9-O-acetylesterase, partial [Planctomycetota bacterium]|nr:9-O-acetylesterase [Planctomycetota bacterium]
VLVGEVWICSGQSNMEWSVSMSNEPGKEIAGARHPQIRLLNVPKLKGDQPQTHIGNATWIDCRPETVAAFSGVGYFFGRELHKQLNVPIGLINSSWGGTVAEAWTSREALIADPTVADIVSNYAADLPRLKELQTKYEKDIASIEERIRDKGNEGVGRGWASPAEPSGEWKEMNLPGSWQSKGLDFSGIFWFRKAVEIPAAWVGKELQLAIGATDKSDVTYFNGEAVGSVTMAQRPDSWSFQRRYTVPAKLVKGGKAVVAVRVHSEKYAGGMTGPAEVMYLACPSLPDSPSIPLAGPWKYATEANYGKVELPPAPMGPDNPNAPSVLYNGMIAPLAPFAIRGAIWYQGESNAGRPKQYRTLFQTLIRDWRKRFGYEIGFHFVQLANYMAVRADPTQSLWAELREAQTMALALPNTGMAVAIEIGEADDIHPRNKQDVGLRLALNALHTTYGKKEVAPCGPILKSAKPEGATLRVSFDHAHGGLVIKEPKAGASGGKSNGKLNGFAIAGSDGKFIWADAKIDGQTVVVSSPSVPAPKAVRYAWGDNPICNLANGAGLPASPGRSDRD